MRAILALLLLGAALLAGPGAAAAGEVVVVASNLPGLAAGTILDGGNSIGLAAGQRITVITGTGQTVRRSGPYSGPLAAEREPADRSLLDALSRLVSTGKKGGAELGAVRGGGKGTPEDPWTIDIGRAGTQCARDGRAPVLWRSNAGRQESLVINGAKDAAMLTWPAQAETLSWPADLPLADGASYRVRLGTTGETKALVLHLVPPSLPTDAHRAAWMADRGCTRQARALLATVAE